LRRSLASLSLIATTARFVVVVVVVVDAASVFG